MFTRKKFERKMDLLLLIGILILVIIFTKLYENTYGFFKRNGICEAKTFPLLGILGLPMLRRKCVVDVHNDVYKQLEGHRVGGTFIFSTPAILVRDPDLIRNIFIKDFDSFTDRSSLGIAAEKDPVFGRNLLALRGQEWRNMRATLSPAFTSSKMRAMFKLISDISKKMSNFLKEKHDELQKENPGELYSMEMKDLFMKFANDVIASTAFCVECDSLNNPENQFQKNARALNNFTFSRLLIVLGYIIMPNFMKKMNFSIVSSNLRNFFHDLIHSNISYRRQNGIIRQDMVHLLMEAQIGTLSSVENEEVDTDNKGKKMNLTDTDVTAQALLFFIAGFDTISTALSFTAYNIAIHEEVQKKLQMEIDKVVGQENELTYDMLQDLKYMDMVFSESLRLFPPAFASDRSCVKRYIIPTSGSDPKVVLEPGQVIWISIYGLHHDPQYFPEPDRFDPERFNHDNKPKIKPCTYIPFGAGPRSCIGLRFAVMEAKAALVHLLQNFNLKVISKTQVPLKLTPGVAMAPEKGIWLGFDPRKHF